MSLLEDVFLEDEADEARDLERVIEGEEYERLERDSEDDGGHRSDEAEEDKRRMDPSQAKPKRVIKNPRFTLNPARLTGPRGIQVIPDHFKDFKFKGKGHEKEDLDLVLKKLEHWAYRLYPKFKFDDCLKKIETLGKKRPVMVHLHRIRYDQLMTDEAVVQKDSSDEEATPAVEDEFDILLQQQIDIARTTPAPNSVRKPGVNIPSDLRTPITMPKATSSPSISEEQKERMLRNRQMAEERRLARLKASNASNITMNTHSVDNTTNCSSTDVSIDNDKENINKGKPRNSNVIASDDSENEENEIIGVRNLDEHKANSGKKSNKVNVSSDDSDVDENEIIGVTKLDEHKAISGKKSNKVNVFSDDSEIDENGIIGVSKFDEDKANSGRKFRKVNVSSDDSENDENKIINVKNLDEHTENSGRKFNKVNESSDDSDKDSQNNEVDLHKSNPNKRSRDDFEKEFEIVDKKIRSKKTNILSSPESDNNAEEIIEGNDDVYMSNTSEKEDTNNMEDVIETIEDTDLGETQETFSETKHRKRISRLATSISSDESDNGILEVHQDVNVDLHINNAENAELGLLIENEVLNVNASANTTNLNTENCSDTEMHTNNINSEANNQEEPINENNINNSESILKHHVEEVTINTNNASNIDIEMQEF